MFSEEALLPLSALQHWIYCPRQFALIHIEQEWADNRFTAEGTAMHERVHDDNDESRPGVRITRGLPVRSLELGISGQCDVVEFHSDGRVIPVEYKRGRAKSHRADEVQICAQGICLEEMLQISVPRGYLYYGRPKRRTEVDFDQELRTLVRETAVAVHFCFREGKTPLASYEAQRCGRCSLIDVCQPKAMRLKRGVSAWFQSRVDEEH